MYDNVKLLTDSAELSLSEIVRITKIDGLGPVVAAVNTTQIGLNPGARFDSVHVDYRNIVIEFYIISSVADNLNELYSVIQTGSKIVFLLNNKFADGYVESIEIDRTNNPVKGQISIICPNPVFYSEAKNVSLSASDFISYSGNQATGFKLYLTAKTAVKNPYISINANKKTKKSTLNIILSAGDILELNSKAGSKSASIASKKVYPYTGNFLWPELVPGDNTITIGAESGTVTAKILYSEKFVALV